MTEKQPRVKIKKILKICKILFILWIIYLIGIPLHYTPYELQPSYWEFKKMCELNELPNNEEKYNKILSYFDKKLGDRDDFPHTKQYSRRIKLRLLIYHNEYYKGQSITSFVEQLKIDNKAITTPKEKYKLDFDKLKSIMLWAEWDTRRINFYGNEGSMEITWDFKSPVSCWQSLFILKMSEENQVK